VESPRGPCTLCGVVRVDARGGVRRAGVAIAALLACSHAVDAHAEDAVTSGVANADASAPDEVVDGGGAIPPGYQLVERNDRSWEIFVGIFLFGIPYVATIADSPKDPWAYVPVAGPFAVGNSASSSGCHDSMCVEPPVWPLVVLDSLMQLAGIAFVIHGATGTHEVLVRKPPIVREDVSAFRFAPTVTREGFTLGLSARF